MKRTAPIITRSIMIEFFIPGDPVPKGRARHARVGAGVRTYTPAKTAKYEAAVKTAARAAMAGAEAISSPVRLSLVIRLAAPSSWSKKRRAEAYGRMIAPTKKPDASNVVKSVEDGMNGVVYRDDSQIVQLVVSKVYSPWPGVAVRVFPLRAAPAP